MDTEAVEVTMTIATILAVPELAHLFPNPYTVNTLWYTSSGLCGEHLIISELVRDLVRVQPPVISNQDFSSRWSSFRVWGSEAHKRLCAAY